MTFFIDDKNAKDKVLGILWTPEKKEMSLQTPDITEIQKNIPEI